LARLVRVGIWRPPACDWQGDASGAAHRAHGVSQQQLWPPIIPTRGNLAMRNAGAMQPAELGVWAPQARAARGAGNGRRSCVPQVAAPRCSSCARQNAQAHGCVASVAHRCKLAYCRFGLPTEPKPRAISAPAGAFGLRLLLRSAPPHLPLVPVFVASRAGTPRAAGEGTRDTFAPQRWQQWRAASRGAQRGDLAGPADSPAKGYPSLRATEATGSPVLSRALTLAAVPELYRRHLTGTTAAAAAPSRCHCPTEQT
jgi:hypothetical protein